MGQIDTKNTPIRPSAQENLHVSQKFSAMDTATPTRSPSQFSTGNTIQQTPNIPYQPSPAAHGHRLGPGSYQPLSIMPESFLARAYHETSPAIYSQHPTSLHRQAAGRMHELEVLGTQQSPATSMPMQYSAVSPHIMHDPYAEATYCHYNQHLAAMSQQQSLSPTTHQESSVMQNEHSRSQYHWQSPMTQYKHQSTMRNQHPSTIQSYQSPSTLR